MSWSCFLQEDVFQEVYVMYLIRGSKTSQIQNTLNEEKGRYKGLHIFPRYCLTRGFYSTGLCLLLLSDHLRHTRRTWSKQTGSGQVSIQKGRAKQLLRLRTQFLPLLSFSSTHLPARAVTEHFCLPSILIQTQNQELPARAAAFPGCSPAKFSLASAACISNTEHNSPCLGVLQQPHPALPYLAACGRAASPSQRPAQRPAVLREMVPGLGWGEGNSLETPWGTS